MTVRGEGGESAGGQTDETDTADQVEQPTKGAGDGASSTPAAKQDAFTKAAARAEAKLTGTDKPAPKADEKPKPKAAEEKPKPKAEEKPKDKPAPKAEEKPKPKAKADDAGDDNDEDDAGDDAGAEEKPKEPLKPRRGWPKRLQTDFQYMTPEEQAARLAEPLQPVETWDDESKANFAKLPVEAQDELLFRTKEIERGYQGKFEALATERKMAEDIKAAIPDRVRQVMTAKGMTEAQTFKALAGLQEHAWRDPVGYLADFIARGNVDLNELADRITATDASRGQQQQKQGQPPVELHPQFQALKAERDRLAAQMSEQQEKQRQANAEVQKEIEFELDTVLAERDEGSGELRYPFARLLASGMADIYEADAESFKGLSPRDAFDLAYRAALQASPELRRYAQKPAPKGSDQADKDADGDKRGDRAKEAQAPKSKTPASAPSSSKGGDAFSRAAARAERRMGGR
jgi:hypothetical protein